jgi:hypothetical protein
VSRSAATAGVGTLSRARFEKFAPPGADTSALHLPDQLTRADLAAALSIVERDRSEFSDPTALIAYIQGQQAELARKEGARAAALLDTDRVITDVVPQRPKATPDLPPEIAAIPAAHRAVYAKAGLEPEEMVRAAALNIGPRDLMALLTRPDALQEFSIAYMPPAPENTARQVLETAEKGFTAAQMLEFHRMRVPVVDQPTARDAGFTPETLLPYIKVGVMVAGAIAFETAGLAPEVARKATYAKLTVETVLEANALGMELDDLGAVLRKQGNTVEGVFDLWRNYDHRLLDGSVRGARLFTTDQLKRLVDTKVIDFEKPLEKINKDLEDYRERKVSFEDMVKVGEAGGDPEGLGWALTFGLTVDDYVKLVRAGAPKDTPKLAREVSSVDDLVRLAQTGAKIDVLQRSISFFKFTVPQTLVIAAAKRDPAAVKRDYVDRGLTVEQAVRVIAAGG